ncbi:MAG: hypothetical protein GX265_04005 [Mollicutes bacterium]|jgi:hypothetical protein|nr:hypothetical protein [Mollicutes bacterium]
MKKNRNAFFESSGFNVINPGMNPQMMNPQTMNPQMMNPQMMPGQITGQSQFYAGPPMGSSNMPADLDARLSKIERQLNRLETRVNKLEGDTGQTSYPENDYNYSNSMYMV